jgi:hypothetical protein
LVIRVFFYHSGLIFFKITYFLTNLGKNFVVFNFGISMKKLLYLVLACIGLLFILNNCSKQTNELTPALKESITKEITNLMEKSKIFAEKLNADSTFASISQDSTATFIFGGKYYSASQTIDVLRSLYSARKSLTFEFINPLITVISPDAALWTANGMVTMASKEGKPHTGFLSESWLWQKVKGKWTIFHIHESLMNFPAKEEMIAIESAVNIFAKDLAIMDLKTDLIKEILRGFLEKNPVIYGSAFAFSKEMIKQDKEPTAFYFFYDVSGLKEVVFPGYDVYKNEGWFKNPVERKNGIWTKPYYDNLGAKRWMITYSVPVYNPKTNELIGVVTGDALIK